MRFTDERHQPRIHQTIRKGNTSGEYITRTLRIVRNDEIYHGLKNSQVVKKVSLITFMDRHHDLTTREYNRRLARQKCKTRGTLQIITRSVRIYGSHGSTSHFKFTTRYDPWYWTILAKLASKNKKEKSRNYESTDKLCSSHPNCFHYISVLKQILASVGNFSVLCSFANKPHLKIQVFFKKTFPSLDFKRFSL